MAYSAFAVCIGLYTKNALLVNDSNEKNCTFFLRFFHKL